MVGISDLGSCCVAIEILETPWKRSLHLQSLLGGCIGVKQDPDRAWFLGITEVTSCKIKNLQYKQTKEEI